MRSKRTQARVDIAASALGEAMRSAYFDGRRDAARDLECAFDGTAPVYVSGSSDRVYPLATMPTRYIQNCLGMTNDRLAKGIRCALEAELRERQNRDGSLRDSR